MKKAGIDLVVLLASLACCAAQFSCKPAVEPVPRTSLPGMPANVHVVIRSGDNVLVWDDVSGATSYKVYFSSDGSTYDAPVPGLSTPEYLLPLYGYYRVSAVNAAGEGSRSAAVHHEAAGVMVALSFDPVGGNIDAAQDIVISAVPADAEIHYTIDGTTPSLSSSPQYTDPIHVATGETVTIKAIAARSGYSNSDLASETYHATGWTIVGSAGFSESSIPETVFGLAFAMDGTTPYVAYRDYSTTKKASVRKFDGSGWALVGSSGFSAGEADYLSMTMDQGNPCLAFTDYSTAKGGSTVMKFGAAGGWQIVGVAGFSADEANYVAMDMGGTTPYVAFQDWSVDGKATVMYYNGSSWSVVGAAGLSAGVASYVSLAISSAGIPFVAYQDAANSGKATVMEYSGGTWTAVGSAGFSAGTVSALSLAIDSNGDPWLAFIDGAVSNKASVMNYSAGSGWQIAGSAGLSTGSTSCVSLEVDGTTPWLAFNDSGDGTKATVMTFNGTSWSAYGPAGFTAGTAGFLVLRLDSGAVPYIAFKDGANSGKATVMAYK